MIKKKKMKKNQGNSYIMVIATVSFLAVLVAAILVAVALCYRLKAFDINARDNFYYLEQAMDEIYAGVGADSMEHLNKAYDETIEVIVYYDAKSKSYITMENDKANKLLKDTFISLVKNDTRYATVSDVSGRLESFVSNLYNADDNATGIQLSVGNVDHSKNDDVTIYNVILKREAPYSTYNTRKNGPGQDTFVQTITTDLVISKPEFDVNFNTIGSELNDLYGFSMIADMGVQIDGPQTKVNITGDIYAASDFYNKDYNGTSTGNELDATNPNYAKINSYDKERLKKCNGVNEKSMYSGIYVGGGDLVVSAKKIIVPGTIAAMNGSNLLISGIGQSDVSYADVWADSIVLGGYSLLKNAADPDDKETVGSIVAMRANCYMADDLEVNAESSEFILNGQYYGYNYASTDNRSYTDSFIQKSKNRTFVDNTLPAIKDAAGLEGQAHYNSSAIIVNGEKATLNLSGVSAMYIAGQSYIELSKKKTTTDKVTDADGNATDYTVTNRDGNVEAVSVDTFDYEEAKKKTDADGNVVYDDNYTVNGKGDYSNIQDYRTGEAISVKSSQLAYIPTTAVTDTEDGMYLKLPEGLKNLNLFKDNWEDLSKIPVIKSVISGKTYYFFDFSTEATKNVKNKEVMNEFIAAYAAMFEKENDDDISEGESYGLTNITDYQYFKINSLSLSKRTDGNGYNIYSNSAITIKDGGSLTIKAKSSSVEALIQAAKNVNENILAGSGSSDLVDTTGDSAVIASSITVKMQNQYKEMKWLLSNQNVDANAVNEAHSLEESDMTPINHFFDFNLLKAGSGLFKLGASERVVKLNSGYVILLSNGDVKIDRDTFGAENAKGLVICKGDVTFETTDKSNSVKSFEGLIVSGGKIIVDSSMDFTANEEIIKSILRECDESRQYTGSDNVSEICQLFKQFKSNYTPPDSDMGDTAVSMKSISAIQFEDILGYTNWKKNVD